MNHTFLDFVAEATIVFVFLVILISTGKNKKK